MTTPAPKRWRTRRTAEARDLLAEGLHLCHYGERAPGGNETWRDWGRKAEDWLRRELCEQYGHDGNCPDCVQRAPAPPLSFEERQIVRRFDEAPNGLCPLCDGVGEVQARLPHVLTWKKIPCPECSAAVER